MPHYLPMISPDDEHNWQRYNIRLSDTALCELLSRLEIEATDLWSFRMVSPRCDDYPVYTFFFAQEVDAGVAFSFDADRSNAS
jgi:hypothetical protein